MNYDHKINISYDIWLLLSAFSELLYTLHSLLLCLFKHTICIYGKNCKRNFYVFKYIVWNKGKTSDNDFICLNTRYAIHTSHTISLLFITF